MKKYYLILLFFILFAAVKSSHSQQYWLTLNSPTNVNLKSCSFVDSLKGWVAGDSGKIVHTGNGGQNWTFQNSSVGDEDIVSIFFLNERLGWGVSWDITFDTNSYGSNILSTTNGGTDWQFKRYPVEDVFINCVTFVDSLTGYLVGYPGIFVKTTNGGLNWIQVEIDSSLFAGFPPVKIKFYNPQYGFACGGVMDLAGVIWRTTNFGEFWYAKGIGPEPIFGIEIFDPQNALCVGGDYEYGPSVSSTTNGGINWSYNLLNIFGIAYAVSFRTRAEGWAPLGYAQKWVLTTDSGRTWHQIDTPDSSKIFDVQFTDIRNGFAVGGNGVILKYNSTIINVPNYNQNIIPTENILYQNYPNPFNPNSKIKFQLSKLTYVKLIVYDVLGREIITLINEQLEPGIHEVGFDGTDLSGGLYFYKLTAGDFFETKKMVLIK